MSLHISYKDYEIAITGESADIPRHDARSTDNVPSSQTEYVFGEDGSRPSSRHRVVVSDRDQALACCVLLAGGGASSVHAHSAFVKDGICFVAVGRFVCALELPSLRLLWQARTDPATCFGIYDAPDYASIISHGELEIARLSYAGELLWAASGRDIFSEGFRLHQHHAEATDFYGTQYRFELGTGQSGIVSP